jgi:CheY-like chemotaxis protein
MNDRPTILILDDEELIIQSLGKTLQKFGCAVVICLHPLEALERLTRTKIDLVISDLRMPAMDGIHFLTELKNQIPDALRVLLVAPEDRETALQAVNCQIADWFLTKPWEEQLLKITLRLLLRCRQAVRENNLPGQILTEPEQNNERISS